MKYLKLDGIQEYAINHGSISDAGKKLHEHDLLTPYPDESGSNGNLSYRFGHTAFFVISATGLSRKDNIEERDVAICHYNERGDVLIYCCEKAPSSESMSHGIIYNSNLAANGIIHVHFPREALYNK